MEFKGTTEDWYTVYTSDNKRAIRSKGGIICFLPKPSRYPNQDERYEKELDEVRANQKLISKAPAILESLKHALSLLEEANLPDELLETQANFCANTFNLIQEATTL